ncbi:MAG: ceramidase domain-containing protein [Rhodobacteraceae bacterium]|nr:ceramidase domain-containing protein [Paracoccaceae bacterium]
MNASGFIDLYCERTSVGLWDEPVNAISNIAFLLAAAWALPVAMRRGRREALELAVILLGGSIGIGSFLFHTMASPAAELADVIPIWSFVALYVFMIIWRTTGQNARLTALISVISLAITGISVWATGLTVTTAVDPAPMRLNGSLQYLPALIALAAFAVLTLIRRHPARHYVIGATLVFILSLVFRTIDPDLCVATAGIGTHFLWHLLNGLMVGLLLQALVRHLPPA